jgi:tetratricopeptide (TPR) repeat protein
MANEEFKNKLTSVFSADVVGYSHLMGENDDSAVWTIAVKILGTIWRTVSTIVFFGFLAVLLVCDCVVPCEIQAQDMEDQKIHKLQEEIAARPDNAILRNNLGVAYGQRAMALYEVGQLKSAIAFSRQAIEQYEIALNVSPSNETILKNLAIAYLNLATFHESENQLDLAECCLIRAAGLFEKTCNEKKAVEAEIKLAWLYRYSMEDLLRAEKKFKELIFTKKKVMDQKTLSRLHVELARTYGKRAAKLYGNDKLESAVAVGKDAIPHYEAALALSPSDTVILRDFGITYLNLATFHESENQLDLAECCLVRAVELFQKAGDMDKVINTEIRLSRLYYYAMEDPARAEKKFQELIARNKDEMGNNILSQVYLELAGIYIMSGDLSKAQSILIKSVQVSGENPQSHLVLGQVYYWLGKKEKAFKEFDKAEKFASSARVKNTIGEAYRQLGLYKEAKRLFYKALEDSSPDVRIAAHVGLGHCLSGEDEIQHYQKAIDLDAESVNPSMLFIRGKLSMAKFTQRGNIQEINEAIQLFNSAIRMKPEESAYHNDLALAYMTLYKETCEESDLESAMNEYRLAEKWYRGFPSSILLSNVAQDYLIYAVAKQNGCEDARQGYYQSTLKAIAKRQSVSPEVVARVDDAISHFERALTISPERKEVYEKLRSVYYGLNRIESVNRIESRASKFGVQLISLRRPE